MKKRNIVLTYLALLGMIVFIGACASTPKSETAGEVIHKTTTTTERPVVQQKQTTTTTTVESK